MKELLERLLNDITVSLPGDLRTEMQTVVDMPEVLSPGRSFMQNTTLNQDNEFARANDTSNHDFLAQIPYSPK